MIVPAILLLLAIQSSVADPPPRQIAVAIFKIEDGMIHQLVEPIGIEAIQGNWAAEIMNESHVVCSGSGVSSYEPKMAPLIMTPEQWTGDPNGCPMVDGFPYTAHVSWEWTAQSGEALVIRSIEVNYEFIYSRPQELASDG